MILVQVGQSVHIELVQFDPQLVQECTALRRCVHHERFVSMMR